MRTMEAPMHMENFKLLGANPTPVPWTELYMTMQQKVVDGQENPLANIWEVKMYEVQKFTSLTGHIYDPMPLVANLAWFKKLSKDQQAHSRRARCWRRTTAASSTRTAKKQSSHKLTGQRHEGQ